VKAQSTTRNRRREAGIALLISIFILLLISVVAIALIVASGTESSLAGNYRSATGVYYAALAGVEEARGRLLPNNANSFKNTAPSTFLPSPLPIGYASYVLNPGPTDGNVLTTYPDTEYDSEFGSGKLASATVKTTASMWTSSPLSTALNLPGPLYKWVRINAISEVSMGRQVAPYDGHTADPAKPIFYDGTQLNVSNSGSQVLEITSLAVLPNGSQNSQKLVQYLAAPVPLNLNFPSALTLDGNNVQFTVPNTGNFWVRGNDEYSAGSCNPGSGVVAAVGYTNSSDSSQSNITSAIRTSPASQDRRGNYTNNLAPNPPADVVPVTVSGNLQTVAGLNALVQTITQNADVVVNGNATQSSMPAAMSASNPMTIVVNGDLTFSGWHSTGYGLLLVTGTFTFDPDATWDGIVLIIGTGKLYSHQGGSGQLNGAVFLAQTVDSSGNPLSSLGSPNFDFTSSSGSNGIYYSSCWIQTAIPNPGYKILSFHEIAQ
jgi:Tfp pilus assembly protein PilX